MFDLLMHRLFLKLLKAQPDQPVACLCVKEKIVHIYARLHTHRQMIDSILDASHIMLLLDTFNCYDVYTYIGYKIELIY